MAFTRSENMSMKRLRAIDLGHDEYAARGIENGTLHMPLQYKNYWAIDSTKNDQPHFLGPFPFAFRSSSSSSRRCRSSSISSFCTLAISIRIKSDWPMPL